MNTLREQNASLARKRLAGGLIDLVRKEEKKSKPLPLQIQKGISRVCLLQCTLPCRWGKNTFSMQT